jgi:zinc D-Ala-D-Ala dipeptidase
MTDPQMAFVEITQNDPDFIVDLRYATPDNFTRRQIYDRSVCLLHPDAAAALRHAAALARQLGYRFRIFDAYRPIEGQWRLWEVCPDTNFVADPRKGSNHNRGIAIDLTLVDLTTGQDADMGTAFDELQIQSYQGRLDISAAALQNRSILLGIMTAAGWVYNPREWWHYQLQGQDRYPLVADGECGPRLMHV